MIKTYGEFVNEELDEFFQDAADSSKRLKLIPKFKSDLSDVSLSKDIEIEAPKKKFKPKVNVMNKKQDKGIF
jgi:hypothetical protein